MLQYKWISRPLPHSSLSFNNSEGELLFCAAVLCSPKIEDLCFAQFRSVLPKGLPINLSRSDKNLGRRSVCAWFFPWNTSPPRISHDARSSRYLFFLCWGSKGLERNHFAITVSAFLEKPCRINHSALPKARGVPANRVRNVRHSALCKF